MSIMFRLRLSAPQERFYTAKRTETVRVVHIFCACGWSGGGMRVGLRVRTFTCVLSDPGGTYV